MRGETRKHDTSLPRSSSTTSGLSNGRAAYVVLSVMLLYPRALSTRIWSLCVEWMRSAGTDARGDDVLCACLRLLVHLRGEKCRGCE